MFPRDDFNPRAPCGARPARCTKSLRASQISIHAPRMGRDLSEFAARYGYTISIHAPRMGRDAAPAARWRAKHDFNPRAPYGARHSGVSDKAGAQAISIHAPRMGRDGSVSSDAYAFTRFQSTRPVWGATAGTRRQRPGTRNFNPRAPYGARPCNPGGVGHEWIFQSTRPVWGATTGLLDAGGHHPISIHAPHAGRDLLQRSFPNLR